MFTRVLSETNVNMNQRATWDACAGDSAEFIGALRLDSIGFEEIVIPDTHFFDGMFFLNESEPESLIAATARGARMGSSITILTRGTDLRSSLLGLLGDGDRLNGFRFQSIEDPAAAEALATLLATTSGDRLIDKLREDSVASDLAGFIKDLAHANGLDVSADIAMIEGGWRRWLEAEDAEVLRTRPYGPPPSERSNGTPKPLDLESAMDWQVVDRRMSDAAAATLDTISLLVRAGNTNRSVVQRVIRDAKVGAASQIIAELDAIDRWYQRGRHSAMAKQHAAGLRVQVWDGDFQRHEFDADVDEIENQIEVPQGFLRRVGLLANEEFQRAVDGRRLRRWWANPTTTNVDELRFIMDSLANAVERAENLPDSAGNRALTAFVHLMVPTSTAVTAAFTGDLEMAGLAGTAALAVDGLFVLSEIGSERLSRNQLVRELVSYASAPR